MLRMKATVPLRMRPVPPPSGQVGARYEGRSLCAKAKGLRGTTGVRQSPLLKPMSGRYALLRAPTACQWSFMLLSGNCLVGILWTFLMLLWRLASCLFFSVRHSLIFKKGDRLEHKNWRPISLVNVDYKVCARVGLVVS